MNKRIRKKQLKKCGQWVNNSELWDLDITICDWIIPRLKQFKKINMAYPGTAPYDTFEKWQDAIDQMIKSFELLKYDPVDLDENLKPRDDVEFDVKKYKKIYDKWKTETDKGLKIFTENFTHLWI